MPVSIPLAAADKSSSRVGTSPINSWLTLSIISFIMSASFSASYSSTDRTTSFSFVALVINMVTVAESIAVISTMAIK